MPYDQSLTIKKWAEEDRPREKLILKGKATLSDAELIAILIGSGTAKMSAVQVSQEILASTENNLNQLAKLSLHDLKKFNGIGEAKAIAIIAALEIGRRRKESEPQKRVKILSSEDLYQYMKANLLDLPHEEFWVCYLNRANQVIKKEQISTGGVSGTVVDSKIIFKRALEELASSIVLVHNHPSGNIQPSQQDIQLTKKLKEAGRILEIPVIDHIIFTDHNYFSFADSAIL
ncbi:RadC family protein [Reichenbachiella ulvae]|uniref:DNA repair protein RadC n=1 Tax=Reichenbachiella ulvae TaxID=2980104 RepID=A0ABT3CYX4_9BACT|nr:DNA repair protein RadC [Reichenbachiella ulvae]MCV9388695.1 DNA repair protein RadC [Reichenbachiella ulvae]